MEQERACANGKTLLRKNGNTHLVPIRNPGLKEEHVCFGRVAGLLGRSTSPASYLEAH